MSMTMVGRRGSCVPTAACIAATESLARCASACLASPGAPEVTSCAEWCVAGARTLGACADVIELGGAERASLVLAEILSDTAGDAGVRDGATEVAR